MLPLPMYLTIGFTLTTGLCLWLVQRVLVRSNLAQTQRNWFWGAILAWMGVQAGLTLTEFYQTDPAAMPPKFPLAVVPTLLFILWMFATKRGRSILDALDLESMTWLHAIRVPVEWVLYGLFIYQAVPELMTFVGRNWDILAGLTAPFIAYWGIRQGKLSRTTLLVWHVLCLGLLLNIVVHAVLAVPSGVQQLAFDQPNVAVLNFPFVWLPSVIVPLVLLAHLASIRQLLQREGKVKSTSIEMG